MSLRKNGIVNNTQKIPTDKRVFFCVLHAKLDNFLITSLKFILNTHENTDCY